MIPEIGQQKNRKEYFEQDSLKHREAFEHELAEMVERTKKVASTALVVGGGFALSYYLFKKISGGKTVKKVETSGKAGLSSEVVIHKQPSVLATVSNVILTEMAIFMLGIAKEKLKDYIEKHNARDEYSENP